MLSVCLRYCKNLQEAEDVLQEGFLNAFGHLEQYRNEGPFEGWLRRIMVNASLRRYEKQARQQPILGLEGLDDNVSTLPDVYDRLGSKDLLLIVQELPPAYRMVFNLYVFEGMKHREIAELLGISEGTSKSNLFDARTLLKLRLQKIESPKPTKPAYG